MTSTNTTVLHSQAMHSSSLNIWRRMKRGDFSWSLILFEGRGSIAKRAPSGVQGFQGAKPPWSWRDFVCTGAENATPKVSPVAAYGKCCILQLLRLKHYKKTLFARLRADILAAKGYFIIVIAPSTLENVVCTFGDGILSACGDQNASPNRP